MIFASDLHIKVTKFMIFSNTIIFMNEIKNPNESHENRRIFLKNILQKIYDN